MSERPLLVITNCPNADVAQAIARHLVDDRLAACVNVLAPCLSIYRWQDQRCEDDEVPMLIKTTASLYPAVEAAIRKHHPFEVPEVIALDIAQGLPAYLSWVSSQVVLPEGER